MKEIVKLWKESKIKECIMEFSCGGDDMGETTFKLIDEDDNEVDDADITGFLEDDVYRNVNFYQNSDGHYIGEFGKVRITLVEDNEFHYSKESTSEWSEQETKVIEIELSDDEVKFIGKVEHFDGGSDFDGLNYQYKDDCILDETDVVSMESLSEKVTEECEDYDGWEHISDDEWFTLEFDRIEGNTLFVSISSRYTHYTNEDN